MLQWRADIAAHDASMQERWVKGWRANALRNAYRLPASFQKHIGAGWDARFGVTSEFNSSPVAEANGYAREAIKAFGDARAGSAFEEEAIRNDAENYARLCSRMATLGKRRDFGLSQRIAPPQAPHITSAGEIARWEDPRWWRGQLRKVRTGACEEAMRKAGIVRKGRHLYASNEAVEHRAARDRRTAEWSESHVMENQSGEQLELLELRKRSIANPSIRRTELMVRARGFKEIACDLGHECDVWTLTTPSAFHPQLSAGGPNPRYEAFTAKQSQQWLCKQWARVRAILDRRNIRVYGIRVAEPHHDGTPHWHLQAFGRVCDLDLLSTVLRGVWLSEWADEPGAREYRVKATRIDPTKGDAAGYLAKYISKNLDGAGRIGEAASDEDEGAGLLKDNVRRVVAWASVHRIRQFQQFGGPPVGLWREVRRMREPHHAEAIEAARVAADKNQWRDFINALGGIEIARRRVSSVRSKYSRALRLPKVRALRLAKNQWKDRHGPRVAWHRRDALPHEMPAVWMDRAEARKPDLAGRELPATNVYREEVGPRTAGVCAFGLLGRFASADTRQHRWRIERKCSPLNSGLPDGRGRTASVTRAADGSKCGPVRSSSTSVCDCSPRSGVLSDLGPVAITVRGAPQSAPQLEPLPPPDGSYAWIMEVPFRAGASLGDPSAWTARETSQAGPICLLN